MTPNFSIETGWPTLTPGQLDRLTRIDLSPEDLAWFVARFVGNRFHFVVEYPSRNGQPAKRSTVSNRPLSPSEVIRHLEGEACYFTGCRWNVELKKHRTEYFVIDLDAGPGMWERYETISKALKPSLLFRSSHSGGLHLWYFLPGPVDLHALRTPEGNGGMVIDVLHRVGLEEVNGLVEVYPRGKYRELGQQNRLRLPFGRGSRLLDPSDPGLPLTASPHDDLRAAKRLFDDGELEFLTLQDLQKDRTTTGPYRHIRRRPTRATGLDASIQELNEVGLSRPKQFNTAAHTKAVDLWRRGVPYETAAKQLTMWLDARHNGKSMTYNASPARAHAEVQEVLERVYSRLDRPKARWKPRPGLTWFELCLVIAATWTEPSLADPSTGETYPRYKVQQFLFEVIQGAKQWIVTRIAEIVDTLANERPSCDPRSDEFGEALFLRLSHIWPNPPTPVFVVEVPYNFLIARPGVSAKTAAALWRIARRAKLFVPIRKGSAAAQRAASFAILLDFGYFGPSDGEIRSLALGLLMALSPNDLNAKYSVHYRRRLRKEGAEAVAELFPGYDPQAVEKAAYDLIGNRMSGMCRDCCLGEKNEPADAA